MDHESDPNEVEDQIERGQEDQPVDQIIGKPDDLLRAGQQDKWQGGRRGHHEN